MVDMHHDSEKRGIRPKNAFKIILDYIDFCALQKKKKKCYSMWGFVTRSFSSLAFPTNEEFDSISPLPPRACRLLEKAKAAQLKEPGLAAQELYIAPPWRCAYTGTRTDAHAGFGMKNRTARNGYTSLLLLSHHPIFFFFRNFPRRVSDFPAVLLPTATSNLFPAETGTEPTPSAQMRSPREDALGSILTVI